DYLGLTPCFRRTSAERCVEIVLRLHLRIGVSQRVGVSQAPEPVFHRRNLHQLLVVTKEATALAAAECLALSETAGLKFPLAVDRSLRPIVDPAKMLLVSAFGSFEFLMISLHVEFLSGSTPRGLLPLT